MATHNIIDPEISIILVPAYLDVSRFRLVLMY